LLVDQGVPVDYVRPKEGTIPLIATLSIPVGAENKPAALAFIDFFLEKSSQEAWVTGYKVGSARTDIDIPADIAKRQITTQADLEEPEAARPLAHRRQARRMGRTLGTRRRFPGELRGTASCRPLPLPPRRSRRACPRARPAIWCSHPPVWC
jgi:ABC-type Fe3+ transport system substrate-binding protein